MSHPRLVAVAAGLVFGLAACDQTPASPPAAPAAVIAPAVSGKTGADQAVVCMAYLALQQGAIEARTPAGDVTAVRAAMNDWEGLALRTMTPDAVNRSFASWIAVEERTAPAVVEVTAAWCVANAPPA